MSGRNSIILPLLVIMMAGACGVRQKPDYSTKAVTRTVSGTELKVRDLEGYRLVCAYGDYLFLQEDRDTSRLVAYRMEGDSLVRYKGLIDRGRGPREFYYVEFALSGDSLFVSNSDPTGMKAIYGISLADMSKIDDPNTWTEYVFSEWDIMTGLAFAPLGPGRFIIAGGKSGTKEIFSLADFTKEREREALRYWPNDSTQGPLASKQMVYMQSRMSSAGDRFVYGNMSARYMFIAAVEDGAVKETASIYAHLPQYEVNPDGNIRYTEDGEYEVEPYVTREYVYAKVGRTVREFNASDDYKGYPRWYVDEVEVYGWDGRFIDNYRTDRPFSTCVVSVDDQYLYTMSIDLSTKVPVIMRYELNKE